MEHTLNSVLERIIRSSATILNFPMFLNFIQVYNNSAHCTREFCVLNNEGGRGVIFQHRIIGCAHFIMFVVYTLREVKFMKRLYTGSIRCEHFRVYTSLQKTNNQIQRFLRKNSDEKGLLQLERHFSPEPIYISVFHVATTVQCRRFAYSWKKDWKRGILYIRQHQAERYMRHVKIFK